MAKRNHTCNCCGKPLTDEISIALGLGPVCRVKRKDLAMADKTGNLFANRAEYTFEVDEKSKVIAIQDSGGAKSVTNDIENILKDITYHPQYKDNPDLMKGYKIMYMDSMGIWDCVKFEISNGSISKVRFFPLTEKDFNKAKAKLISL
jgi:hypothetical protein